MKQIKFLEDGIVFDNGKTLKFEVIQKNETCHHELKLESLKKTSFMERNFQDFAFESLYHGVKINGYEICCYSKEDGCSNQIIVSVIGNDGKVERTFDVAADYRDMENAEERISWELSKKSLGSLNVTDRVAVLTDSCKFLGLKGIENAEDHYVIELKPGVYNAYLYTNGFDETIKMTLSLDGVDEERDFEYLGQRRCGDDMTGFALLENMKATRYSEGEYSYVTAVYRDVEGLFIEPFTKGRGTDSDTEEGYVYDEASISIHRGDDGIIDAVMLTFKDKND